LHLPNKKIPETTIDVSGYCLLFFILF